MIPWRWYRDEGRGKGIESGSIYWRAWSWARIEELAPLPIPVENPEVSVCKEGGVDKGDHLFGHLRVQ